MASERIIWTVLPQGLATQGGKKYLWVTLYVSPRLYGAQSGSLSSFPDFQDWPSLVGQMEFGLNFGGSFQTAPAPLQGFRGDSGLWKNLFKQSTYVRSHEFDDNTQRRIWSFPVGMVTDFVKEQYIGLATASPTEFPSVQKVLGRDSFGGLVFGGETGNLAGGVQQGTILRKNLEAALSRHRALGIDQIRSLGFATPTQAAFMLAKIFHEPRQVKQQPLPRYPADKGRFEEMLDFHQMVSALSNFPEIIRRLGLLLDLYVPASSVPNSAQSSPLWVQAVSPDFDATRDYAPQTSYLYDGKSFTSSPEPSSTGISGGMLPFNDLGRFNAVQVDADGVALKTLDFANSVSKAQRHRSQDTPGSYATPSLRSGGLSVTEVDRAVHLASAFGAAKGHDDDLRNNAATLLHAEDVTRGFRVDVWDSTSQKWHSLNWRSGVYTYFDDNKLERQIASGVVDEGWVQTATTESSDPSIPKNQKDLSLHESLFAWKGWSLSVTRPGQTIDPKDDAKRVEPVPATQLKVRARFTPASGTLPRLRYGRNYRLRARTVDLGGGGLGVDEADDSSATAEVPYLRFEPVPPPFIVLRKGLDPDKDAAESIERIVIRSFNDSPSKDTVATNEVSERHVAPPRTSQQMAEEHGMFDDSNTGKMKYDPMTYGMIVAGDAAKLNVTMSNNPIDVADQMALPYLPDPVAAGASLVGLPGPPSGTLGKAGTAGLSFAPVVGPGVPAASVTLVGFGSAQSWPHLSPFRIRVEEGQGPPTWDPGSRVLHVFLPKSVVVKFRISSFMVPKDLAKMGLFHWVQEARLQGKVADPAFREMMAVSEQGRHWMVTPFKEVNLVHAVQQPIGIPEFESLQPIRNMGWTFALLSGKAKVHGSSTVKIDVSGRWDERRDDPGDPTNDPVKDRVHGSSHAFDFPLDPSENEAVFTAHLARRHEFGDTRYRHMYYKVVATSRFKEYLPKSIREDPNAPVFRESKEFELDVPNAAKPAAPSVLYILPIFGWQQGVGSSVRKGRGLRVYLNRPWFSSGDGERLGAILWPGKIPTDPDGLERAKTAVTMLGSDPIWASPSTPQNLKITDFGNALPKVSRGGLPLDELQGAAVDVAAHDVHYDYERRLWYCDITIESGDSYFPFVRLALARFQPNSVPGAHLSKAVIADFAQLAPDRTLTIMRIPNAVKVALSGHSYGPGGGLAPRPGPQVEVSLEKYDPAIGTNLGWVSEPNASVMKDPTLAPLQLFSGTVTFPPPQQGGQAPQLPPKYRLVVKEYEILQADRSQADLVFALGGSAPPAVTARRLVYADLVEL